jgi:OmpA-OmpF porin, OOP family
MALTIGNFIADKLIKVQKTKRKFPVSKNDKMPKNLQPMIAYYFIDDIKVTPLDPTEPIYPQELLVHKELENEDYFGPVQVGKKFILQNIQFNFNESNLLESSFDELDKLFDYLTENEHIKIEIEGHTDNIGTIDYNNKLSAERGKAVAYYITKVRGLEDYRVKYRGFGSSQPIVSNETAEGQAMNRRVEFVILEK